MEEKIVTYVGEHLAIGNWGKLAVYLSMAASFFAAVCYLLSFKLTDNKIFWRNLGRAGFWVQSLAVVAVFVILFVIIQQHFFEYQYAWQHSSTQLPLKYMISCFWEGQEGSFLLWMVWHVVIGNILIFTAKSWESPVMTIISVAQLMLATMLIGIELFGYKIGSSPFDLLRDKVPGPIFSRPDYLNFIKDGNGLNPLLQNYWMVIHPPTLFFGFAASIVPFAYAVSGLWARRHTDWVKPALPWALAGVMVLGTGIIMGGFWAYESLTFGGYWAWDPVENASLIPWLILIAAVHLMLIYRSTGNALYSTYLFTIFAFILVLYATFLTRSGILGTTSVHSFTDLGMSGQLLIFLFLFFWLPTYVTIQKTNLRWVYLAITIAVLGYSFAVGSEKWLLFPYTAITFILFFVNIYKANPVKGKEEEFSSREFWMFIGALLFVVSGIYVLGQTSRPVFNKLFGGQLANPENVMDTYNSVMMPIAMIIAVLTAISQFFKYKKTGKSYYFNNIIISLSISILLTSACIYIFKLKEIVYIFFLLTAIYTVVANIYYIVKVLRGKLGFSGGSVAHVGFGLLLAGVLISSANKNVISKNTTGADLGENFDNKGQMEHTLLWRNMPTRMDKYLVTYLSDSLAEPDNFFKIQYRTLDKEGKPTGEEFYLYPNSQKNKKMGLVSNPDTRHYFSHDVFTYVSQIPDKEGNKDIPYTQVYTDSLRIGDTVFTNNALVVLEGISVPEGQSNDENVVVGANLMVRTLVDTLSIIPRFILENGISVSPEERIDEAGLKIRFTGILPDIENRANTRFIFEVAERKPLRDYVVLKAVVFPFINFVWAGTIIMVIGFAMSILRRIKEYKRGKTANV